MSSRPPERPSGPPKPPGTPTPSSRPWPRWLPLVMLGVVVAIFLFTTIRTDTPERASLSYTEFSKTVSDGNVKSVSYDPSNGNITGEFKTPQDGKTDFSSSGPNDDLQPTELKQLKDQGVNVEFIDRQGEGAFVYPERRRVFPH